MGSDGKAEGEGPRVSDFNPRSPCGERRPPRISAKPLSTFQSTLPVWGATCFSCLIHAGNVFQSTLPVWGATIRFMFTVLKVWISIHAPRVGSDLSMVKYLSLSVLFQSTLPVWGATRQSYNDELRKYISIHAPRVGSDWTALWTPTAGSNFNPRSPCGERRRPN